MRNLKVELLAGDILKFRLYIGGEVLLSFVFWKFQGILSIFNISIWKIMGVCRFHAFFRGKCFFHWCDLCVVPRIKGVNL